MAGQRKSESPNQSMKPRSKNNRGHKWSLHGRALAIGRNNGTRGRRAVDRARAIRISVESLFIRADFLDRRRQDATPKQIGAFLAGLLQGDWRTKVDTEKSEAEMIAHAMAA
jgi:hypothetical protein